MDTVHSRCAVFWLKKRCLFVLWIRQNSRPCCKHLTISMTYQVRIISQEQLFQNCITKWKPRLWPNISSVNYAAMTSSDTVMDKCCNEVGIHVQALFNSMVKTPANNNGRVKGKRVIHKSRSWSWASNKRSQNTRIQSRVKPQARQIRQKQGNKENAL